MATISRRKWSKKISYVAQVRRKGFKTLVKSFRTRTEAKKWGRAVERDWDQGKYIDYSEAQGFTLGEVMQRYIREDKHKQIKSWRMHEFRIAILLKDTISDTNLLRLFSKPFSKDVNGDQQRWWAIRNQDFWREDKNQELMIIRAHFDGILDPQHDKREQTKLFDEQITKGGMYAN